MLNIARAVLQRQDKNHAAKEWTKSKRI